MHEVRPPHPYDQHWILRTVPVESIPNGLLLNQRVRVSDTRLESCSVKRTAFSSCAGNGERRSCSTATRAAHHLSTSIPSEEQDLDS